MALALSSCPASLTVSGGLVELDLATTSVWPALQAVPWRMGTYVIPAPAVFNDAVCVNLCNSAGGGGLSYQQGGIATGTYITGTPTQITDEYFFFIRSTPKCTSGYNGMFGSQAPYHCIGAKVLPAKAVIHPAGTYGWCLCQSEHCTFF
jgi:hypothetical protein